MLTYVELARWVPTATLGVFLAVLTVGGIGFCYSGGIWLLLSGQSPVSQHLRRRGVERTVRRETADLDRRFAEFTDNPRFEV